MVKIKEIFKKHTLSVLIVIGLVVGVFLFWSRYKVIWFCDEIYSYFTANSEYSVNGRLEYGKWYDSSFVIDDMTADLGRNFTRTIKNVKGNVHPPIFYLTMHAMSLIMRGSISKWVGLWINLICYIGIGIFLYILFYLISQKRSVSVVAAVVFTYLPSMLTNAMLIRMYCMLVAWATLYILLSYMTLIDIRSRVRYALYPALTLTVALGFLTQYYFSVFVVGFTFIYVIYRLAKREWKESICYIVSMILSVVLATILWDYWPKQVFGGYRGSDALNEAANISKLIRNFAYGISTVFDQMFFNLKIIGIVAVVAMLIYIIYRKNKNVPFIVMLLGGALLAAGLICHVTPDYLFDYRYLYVPTAAAYISFVIMVISIAGYVPEYKNKNVACYGLLGIILMFNVLSALFNDGAMGYVDKSGEYNRKREILKEYSNLPWVYYGYEDWSLMENYYDLALGTRFIAFNDMFCEIDGSRCPADGEDFIFIINDNFYDSEEDDMLAKLDRCKDCHHEAEFLFKKGALFYLVRHK